MEEGLSAPQAICLRCGEANPEGTSRCESCKSPLDHFASSSPWEMGSAKHTAYQEAADPAVKPIVFWGVWIWFGPSVVISFLSIISLLSESDSRGTFVEESLFLLVLPTLYFCLGSWALVSVTKGYLRKRSEESKEPED